MINPNKNTVRLENWRYLVDMGCNDDRWRLNGNVFGHPNIDDGKNAQVSTPQYYDAEKRIVVTLSGRQYELGRCGGNEEEQIRYILEDIARSNQTD